MMTILIAPLVAKVSKMNPDKIIELLNKTAAECMDEVEPNFKLDDEDGPHFSCDEIGVFVNCNDGRWDAGDICHYGAERDKYGSIVEPGGADFVETALNFATPVEALAIAICKRHMSISSNFFSNLDDLHSIIDELQKRIDKYEPMHNPQLTIDDGVPF